MKLFAALLVSFALPAFAADAAPAAAAPTTALPKPNCEAPEYPGRLASDQQRNSFNKKYKAYGECVRKFVDEQTAIMKAATDAGNAAIAEYNNYNIKLKEQTGE